jgi:GNAT superfamily N-acetyltransferase
MTRPSNAEAKAPGETIETVVTYLEMTEPPRHAPAGVPRPGLEIRHARACTVFFYRSLYDAVGGPWTWTERRLLPDDELGRILADPRVEVHVLRADGAPAGYVELDRRREPDIEIAYFGLLPAFIGQGLGRYLLDWAVARAWRAGPARICPHTCALDHPRALAVYEAAGFRAYRSRRERVAAPPRGSQAVTWPISSTMPS